MPDWKWLTGLGDSLLLLPGAVILAILLGWQCRRLAVVMGWLLAFGITGGIVCLSKIAFLGWGLGIQAWNFTGFSGHSALSSAFWPVALWAFSRGRRPAIRGLAWAAAVALPLIIGLSRLSLHVHSTSEVISGLTLGWLCSSVFLFRYHDTPSRPLPGWLIALLLLIPLWLASQHKRAPTQQWLEKIATTLAGADKPWTRHKLLQSQR